MTEENWNVEEIESMSRKVRILFINGTAAYKYTRKKSSGNYHNYSRSVLYGIHQYC